MNPNISLKDVSQPEYKARAAIEALVAEGLPTTYENIRARCGGSYTSVSRALRMWRDDLEAKAEREVTQLPAEVIQAAREHAAVIWQRAEQFAAGRSESILRELRERLELAEQREREALAAADRSVDEAAKAAGFLAAIRGDLEVLRRQFAAQGDELLELRRAASDALKLERQLRAQLLDEAGKRAMAEGRVEQLSETLEHLREDIARKAAPAVLSSRRLGRAQTPRQGAKPGREPGIPTEPVELQAKLL